MSDVFISYSRKDQDFIRNLNESLTNRNLTTWVDWQGISKGTKWWKEIEIGIEGTDVFVFVISPDSVISKPCQDEIKYAIKHNKKILPLVYKDADNFWDEENSAHKVLKEIDWILFRETDDFETSFKKLLEAQKLDIEYVHQHTSLLLRALDWENQGKKSDYLLRGSNLETAEKWLAEGNDKNPKPTDSHIDFIENSRKVENANTQEILSLKKRKEKLERQIKQGLIFLGVTVVGAVAALGFAGFKMIEAQNNLENTNIKVGATEAKALWIENPQTLDNLLVALKTGSQLQNRLKQNTAIPNLVQWQTKIASNSKFKWYKQKQNGIRI